MIVKELKEILKNANDNGRIGVSVKKHGLNGIDTEYVSDGTKIKVEFDKGNVKSASVWIMGEYNE